MGYFTVIALFLKRHGYAIGGAVDDQEQLILRVASGEAGRDELTRWLELNMVEES